jgi:hypothetical protein
MLRLPVRWGEVSRPTFCATSAAPPCGPFLSVPPIARAAADSRNSISSSRPRRTSLLNATPFARVSAVQARGKSSLHSSPDFADPLSGLLGAARCGFLSQTNPAMRATALWEIDLKKSSLQDESRSGRSKKILLKCMGHRAPPPANLAGGAIKKDEVTTMAAWAPIIPTRNKGGPVPKEEQIRQQILESLPLEEQLSRRAHEIYLERGGQDGSDLDEWLQAEAEILAAQEKEV